MKNQSMVWQGTEEEKYSHKSFDLKTWVCWELVVPLPIENY